MFLINPHSILIFQQQLPNTEFMNKISPILVSNVMGYEDHPPTT